MLKIPQLIIVTGPESSGTRLVHSLFDYPILDRDDIWEDPKVLESLPKQSYAVHRSLPHYVVGPKRKFYEPVKLFKYAKKIGYDSKVIICLRDRSITSISKTESHNVGNHLNANFDIDKSMVLIKDIMSRIPVTLFSYETYMNLNTEYLDYLKLPYNRTTIPTLIDGNIKYLKSHKAII